MMTGFGDRLGHRAFEYRRGAHYRGRVQVHGLVTRRTDRGRAATTSALPTCDYLAHHRPTAEHIATQAVPAVRRATSRPQAWWTRSPTTYLANGTAIVPVLRKLFALDRVPASIGQKVRRPDART